MSDNFQNLIPNTDSEKQRSNLKIWIIILIFVVAVISAFIFIKKDFLMGLLNGKKEEAINLSLAPKYTKTDLAVDKLLEVFPENIIQEKNPVVLENYQAEIGKNIIQYSIKYSSKNTSRQIFMSYYDYFTKNNFGLLPNNKVSENLSYISAIFSKEKKTIYINSSFDEVSKMSIVDITLIQNK